MMFPRDLDDMRNGLEFLEAGAEVFVLSFDSTDGIVSD
jgi:hypothetical protein